MSNGPSQTTLSHNDSLSERLCALDLGLVAAWYAFELATSAPGPVTTGAALSQQLFDELLSAGIVCEGPALHGEVRRTLYEPFVWRYPNGVPPVSVLQSRLRQHLEGAIESTGAQATRNALWERLANAEIHTYLTHLLRKHALDTAGAGAVLQTMDGEWDTHPLGRKRYLAWQAVRGAASVLLQSGSDQKAAYDALVNELRRRSRWLLLQEKKRTLSASEYSFLPEIGWRTPILVRVLQEFWMSGPPTYWARLPS